MLTGLNLLRQFTLEIRQTSLPSHVQVVVNQSQLIWMSSWIPRNNSQVLSAICRLVKHSKRLLFTSFLLKSDLFRSCQLVLWDIMIPSASCLHVEVSLSKTLQLKLSLMSRSALPCVSACVCGWARGFRKHLVQLGLKSATYLVIWEETRFLDYRA